MPSPDGKGVRGGSKHLLGLPLLDTLLGPSPLQSTTAVNGKVDPEARMSSLEVGAGTLCGKKPSGLGC